MTRTCCSMPIIRGRSSMTRAEPGSRSCSRGPISYASLGLPCGPSSGLQQIPRVRTSPFHVRSRSGDLLLARSASCRDSRPGRAALGHPARSCARRTGCRPPRHGRRPRRNRARARRYGLHDGSRLLAVFRAQMDKPSRGKPLTNARTIIRGLTMMGQATACELRNLDSAANSD